MIHQLNCVLTEPQNSLQDTVSSILFLIKHGDFPRIDLSISSVTCYSICHSLLLTKSERGCRVDGFCGSFLSVSGGTSPPSVLVPVAAVGGTFNGVGGTNPVGLGSNPSNFGGTRSGECVTGSLL